MVPKSYGNFKNEFTTIDSFKLITRVPLQDFHLNGRSSNDMPQDSKDFATD